MKREIEQNKIKEDSSIMKNFSMIGQKEDEDFKKSFKKYDQKSNKSIIDEIQSLKNNKKSEIVEDYHNEYDEEFWNNLKQSFR